MFDVLITLLPDLHLDNPARLIFLMTLGSLLAGLLTYWLIGVGLSIMLSYISLDLIRRYCPLMPDLIPFSMHGVNARSAVSQATWRKASQQVRREAKGVCEICSGRTKFLEAHEKWEWYKDEQRLVKLQALCVPCHRVKHIGRTRAVLGYAAYKSAITHMAKTNKISKRSAKILVAKSFAEVKTRKGVYHLKL